MLKAPEKKLEKKLFKKIIKNYKLLEGRVQNCHSNASGPQLRWEAAGNISKTDLKATKGISQILRSGGMRGRGIRGRVSNILPTWHPKHL
jgi:hypothetical protein